MNIWMNSIFCIPESSKITHIMEIIFKGCLIKEQKYVLLIDSDIWTTFKYWTDALNQTYNFSTGYLSLHFPRSKFILLKTLVFTCLYTIFIKDELSLSPPSTSEIQLFPWHFKDDLSLSPPSTSEIKLFS